MVRSYTLHHPAALPGTIDYASELNPQQLAAVQSPPGPSLVIAGAGTGKTRTLTFRVAWLLEQGVPPSNILLLTFTNKAAREMLDRVAAIIPAGAAEIWGGTFHSIGNRILRRHAEEIGFQSGFSIMDREDQESMIDAVVAHQGLRTTDRRFPKGSVLAEIFGLSINCETPIPAILASRYPYFLPIEAQIERIAVAYEMRKKEANSMDFDDLLAKVLELFETNESIAERYRNQFQYVLVDEYQDTNRLQAELIDRITSQHRNVMVVGDDAQSIYSWRGANFENILQFPEKHSAAQIYKIETNYRSVPEVLELANAIILENEKQFRKELCAARPASGVRPALVPLSTNNAQASFVAQRILEMNEEGRSFREMAVLYRAHYQSLEVQLEFTRRGIPFSITSGLRFFEQAHIKDVAAFMKFSVNPRDEIAFKRMVKLLPGIGAKSAEALWSKIAATLDSGQEVVDVGRICKVPTKAQKSWDQLLHTLQELRSDGTIAQPVVMIEAVLFAFYDDYMRSQFPNYDARREDLHTLQNYAKQFTTTEEFLSQLALLGAVETDEALHSSRNDDDKVTLSSVHQAKGLEWQSVFVIWLTDGMFPSSRAMDYDDDVEEERRLFYVAVTRCKDELYLTYPELRLNAGYGEAFQRPSRFIQEIPEALYERWEVQFGFGTHSPMPSNKHKNDDNMPW